jgi:hypothetical protein
MESLRWIVLTLYLDFYFTEMNDSLTSKQMLIIRSIEGTATRNALNACVYCMLPPSKRFEIFVK